MSWVCRLYGQVGDRWGHTPDFRPGRTDGGWPMNRAEAGGQALRSGELILRPNF
jgi:hypothetical protein